MFLENWKRLQMRLGYFWDLTGIDEEEFGCTGAAMSDRHGTQSETLSPLLSCETVDLTGSQHPGCAPRHSGLSAEALYSPVRHCPHLSNRCGDTAPERFGCERDVCVDSPGGAGTRSTPGAVCCSSSS
ncbi:hypothetical protein CB1_000216024 [Camelus ferus]|nr:hypothetical protein CB1_000216024 [Camelus ferus]